MVNNPLRYTDPTGHKCNPDDGCETPHGDKGNGTGSKGKDKDEDPEELLKKNINSGTTWNELTPEQQAALLAYQCGPNCWAENQHGTGQNISGTLEDWPTMVASVVAAYIALHFVFPIIKGAIVTVLTQWATANPDSMTVSIGNYTGGTNDYVGKAITNGYTYFNPGRFTPLLKVTGLLNPVNDLFIENQIAESKDFVTTILSDVHPGLDIEITTLLESGYVEVASAWTEFSSYLLHPAVQSTE